MTMVKTILLVLAVVLGVTVAIVVALAVSKPDTLTVQRSVTIKAPPEKIFPLINDFKSWATWSPYEKKDPAMKRDFSGAASGKGAVYAWDGDKNVGAGRMEMLEALPSSKLTIRLDFSRPFETHNTAEFTILPQGDATAVTWTMRGPSLFISKVMQVFFDMDAMIGKDFEVGLANLKAITEKN
jgi:uncharacterized protein YndB with AHSA1/START domain